jgi:hypothetical protein
MKKIIKLIILCIIFAQYSGIKAQSTHVSVDSIIGFPSQAYYGSTYILYVALHNYDSAYYQGNVYIVFHTDTNNVIDTIGGSNQVNIPGDSTEYIYITGFSFDSTVFKLGGNVVVVWPVNGSGTQIMMTDTFYTYVDILGYAGILEVERNDRNSNIFPVPASDMLFLPQNIAENSIEHVRIIDMLGRTKVLLRQYSKSISVAELENGFYFLEIKEKNNQIRIFKFIVSR